MHAPDPSRLSFQTSASRAPTMTDPGTFVLIDTEVVVLSLAPSLSPGRPPVSSRQSHASWPCFRFQLAQELAWTYPSTVIMSSPPSKMCRTLAARETLDFHRRHCWG